MKTFKRISTLVVSLGLSASILTIVPANAVDYSITWGTSDLNFEICEDLTEYFYGNERYGFYGDTYTVLRNLDREDDYVLSSNCHDIEAKKRIDNEFTMSSFYFDLATYVFVDDEKAVTLSSYLSKNYPELTLTPGDTDEFYVINYDREYSFDEQFEIALQIKEDLGFICQEVPYEDCRGSYTIGDINNDANVTPTDASLILNYYSDSQSNIEYESVAAVELTGDIDNNGKVTPIDAALILEYYSDEQTSMK